ncbi:MAG: 4-(cytidine 5'-diphospho)-2-C-methyl-D-erythritol kinase [Candidatus Omnitrophica bacterium]|nr:4-(cytidine 5'-diphospho)-2-C-methyl-D-erythritol kinase [Candidatus Omnitrophota bacterium]
MPRTKRSVNKFSLSSPAKLNLALQITGRDADGFHLLNTVFERISLADRIDFKSAADEGIRITCSHPDVPCDERNLVYKAALALRQATGVVQGANIHIQKTIPVAAGLAGGSSNGATALLGLNKLWNLKLPHPVLLKLAKKLGSDIAFFLHDASFALGTRRGERIRLLPIKHRFWHVLITDKQPLLTKDVYGVFAAKFLAEAKGKGVFTKKSADVRMLIRSLKQNDVAAAQKVLFNDLEGPIRVLRPGLLKLKDKVVKQAGAGVCFSGSGPSIFALTQSKAEAERIAGVFRSAYEQVFVVRTA